MHDVGIKTCALTMCGNIGETYETINDTVALLREIGVMDIGTIGKVWVLPGTKLHGYCQRKKMITEDYWLGPEEVFVFREGWTEKDQGLWHGAICIKKFINKEGEYTDVRPK